MLIQLFTVGSYLRTWTLIKVRTVIISCLDISNRPEWDFEPHKLSPETWKSFPHSSFFLSNFRVVCRPFNTWHNSRSTLGIIYENLFDSSSIPVEIYSRKLNFQSRGGKKVNNEKGERGTLYHWSFKWTYKFSCGKLKFAFSRRLNFCPINSNAYAKCAQHF